MKTFESKNGVVLGNLWGGGTGAYPTSFLYARSLEELRKKATKGLDGSLDSGMGFESLIGAVMDVKITDEKVINGKKFYHDEYTMIEVGDLTEEQREFCYHAFDNYHQ